jgi:hypothetical protein
MLQKERDEILSTTLEDLKGFAKMVDEVMAQKLPLRRRQREEDRRREGSVQEDPAVEAISAYPR